MNDNIFELLDVTNKAIFVFNAVRCFELISRPAMHPRLDFGDDVAHLRV